MCLRVFSTDSLFQFFQNKQENCFFLYIYKKIYAIYQNHQQRSFNDFVRLWKKMVIKVFWQKKMSYCLEISKKNIDTFVSFSIFN